MGEGGGEVKHPLPRPGERKKRRKKLDLLFIVFFFPLVFVFSVFWGKKRRERE